MNKTERKPEFTVDVEAVRGRLCVSRRERQ